MYQYYNPNPMELDLGDCSVRAISKALNVTWERAYMLLVKNGFTMADMPTSNIVIGATLRQYGFKGRLILDTCPDCYTVADFIRDNPKGTYVLFSKDHVATVIDGVLYDSYNSLRKTVEYVWYKD